MVFFYVSVARRSTLIRQMRHTILTEEVSIMETHETLRDAINKVINELPPSQVAEVLDFARFIRLRGVETVPAKAVELPEADAQSKMSKRGQTVLKVGSFDDLQPLIGIVALGGDAVADCDDAWE